MMKLKMLATAIVVLLLLSCFSAFVLGDLGTDSPKFSINAGTPPPPPPPDGNGTKYTINQTLSDGAQRDTIAFDCLAFLTGNLGGQSFLPPGKVADLSGFQYLRDNDPTSMGHNTDFVTIIAFNILHILTQEQLNQLISKAKSEVTLINEYAYQRFPLMEAFRRLLEGNLPQGSTGLDKRALMDYTAELGQINGQILYDKAQLLGGILRSLTTQQKNSLDSLKLLGGVGNWNKNLTDPLKGLNLDRDVNIAVMTYASEMYSWYAGSVEADTYFCPEGEGTYFGSFYLKDWPAMGNPNYTINEQLTASAGEDFLKILTTSQAEIVTGLVDIQKSDLYEIVQRRSDLATVLRGFLTGTSVNNATVMNLAERYGELDGEIVYYYATHFTEVYQTLNSTQKAKLEELVDALGYVPCTGAFLYSSPINMPEIINTDFLFGTGALPAAAFTFFPTAPTTGQTVNFTDTSTGSPTSWSWSFGDGSTSTLQNPTHAYSAAGSYAVALTASNTKGSNATTKLVTVSQRSFSLTSDAGVDGGTLPAECTCDGSGISPALAWSNAPAGTKEFALMMTTLPGDGSTKWCWVLYSIPGTATSLAKNTSGVGILGVSHRGTRAYEPPCSQGPGAKIYTFTLYALSASPALPAADQVTGAVLTEAIASITLGSASLSLSYTRSGTTLSTDMNGDGKVDIIDIAIVARGFGSASGKSNWNPIADVNSDGVINIIDIATVAREYKV